MECLNFDLHQNQTFKTVGIWNLRSILPSVKCEMCMVQITFMQNLKHSSLCSGRLKLCRFWPCICPQRSPASKKKATTWWMSVCLNRLWWLLSLGCQKKRGAALDTVYLDPSQRMSHRILHPSPINSPFSCVRYFAQTKTMAIIQDFTIRIDIWTGIFLKVFNENPEERL